MGNGFAADELAFLRRAASLVAAGISVIALLALSDDGVPAYDHENAQAFAAPRVPTFACTPDQFPDLMAAAIEKRDLAAWGAREGGALRPCRCGDSRVWGGRFREPRAGSVRDQCGMVVAHMATERDVRGIASASPANGSQRAEQVRRRPASFATVAGDVRRAGSPWLCHASSEDRRSEVDAMAAILFVRIKSGLDAEEFERRLAERRPRFREVPGLVQKIYGRDEETGDVCGIYFFDSGEALAEFRETELARTIPSAYEAVDVRREVYELLYPLWPERGPFAADRAAVTAG
jgi:Putative mono-oxygenase ydhR